MMVINRNMFLELLNVGFYHVFCSISWCLLILSFIRTSFISSLYLISSD